MREHIDPALQEDQLNLVREDCENTGNRRDSSILEVQRVGTHREATEEDLDNTALQEEQLNVARKDCDRTRNETDSLILEVRHMRTDKQAREEELDDDVLLEERSDLVRRDCGNLVKARDYLELKYNTRGQIDVAARTDRRRCARSRAVKLWKRKLRQHRERESLLKFRSPTDRSGKKSH
jgi:hypothetical protein